MTIQALLPPLVGGMLIGLAASGYLLFNGRVAGISGIVGGLLQRRTGDRHLQGAFVIGLSGAGLLLAPAAPEAFVNPLSRSTAALVVAGMLVGAGTRLGNGCTSGHGVCGLARSSPRSLVSVLTFMATGAASATAVSQWLGGGL